MRRELGIAVVGVVAMTAALTVVLLPSAGASKKVAAQKSVPVFSPDLARNVTPIFSVPKAIRHKVAVVGFEALPTAQGPSIGYAEPFAVRNGTKKTIANLSADGVVKNSAGKIVDTGSDQGFSPTRLEPGQEAFAFIYFQSAQSFPAGAALPVKVSYQDLSTPDTYKADLSTVQVNNTGTDIVGESKNIRKDTVQGPVSVDVYCVDANGIFTGPELGTFADLPDSSDNVTPGASYSFDVGLDGSTCPTYVVGSTGFDQKDIAN